MDAKQASAVAQRVCRAQEDTQREAERKRREDTESAARMIAKSLIAQLEAEIPKAAEKGWVCVSDDGPHSGRGGDAYSYACSIACEYFHKKGFKADHSDGEREMGDNEYPCTDYYHTITVSWSR